MKIVSIRIRSVATIALTPMLIAASQASTLKVVRVQAIEPARAANLQQSVSGNCYGRKAVVDFIRSSSKSTDVDTIMKVTVDGKVHSFGRL